ncbi:50S ribosomal protein L23 [Candidatus Nomurabacteria bacterium]|nr:50S ribosomal protein L23 [Candidatus Kaiserbacteria bacterium]MCB9814648.1 50S ribosomal protein L23 [Candidatus Nomurabacteria bacterium]
MALFSLKKETPKENAADAPKVKVNVSKALVTDRNISAVIERPRITEKSVKLSEQNVYTFTVKRNATKFSVRDAVIALYNVTPVKVNIVNKKPAKRLVGSRNRVKHAPGVKKAYVYLKKGDTINLV